MNTRFRTRKITDGPNFTYVTRQKYKDLVRMVDKGNVPYRVGTLYQDGISVKSLTILENQNAI